jgi:hypothetical protein
MDDTRRMLAVVDLDGVLADVRHRLHHLERTPKDWPAFFAAAVEDPVLEVGRDAVRRLAAVHEVVYLSGRPEGCRADSQRWLSAQGLPPGELHLRPSGDFRPARIFKVEALRRLSERAPVAVLVDDDPAVCEAARLAGFDVLPATWMGDEQQLWQAQEEDGAT